MWIPFCWKQISNWCVSHGIMKRPISWFLCFVILSKGIQESLAWKDLSPTVWSHKRSGFSFNLWWFCFFITTPSMERSHRGSRIRHSSKCWFIFSYFKRICYLTPQPSLWLQFRKAFKQVAIIKLNETQWGFCPAYLFSRIKEFFWRLKSYFSPAVLCYGQFIRKLMGIMEVWSRRLINSTSVGQAVLGACYRKINKCSKMATKQGSKYVGKKKQPLGVEHNSSVTSLEKLIITPLVTVIDCQFLGLRSVQGSERWWWYSVLGSPPSLCSVQSLDSCIQCQWPGWPPTHSENLMQCEVKTWHSVYILAARK